MNYKAIPFTGTAFRFHFSSLGISASLLSSLTGMILYSATLNALEYEAQVFADMRYDDNANTAADTGHDTTTASGLQLSGGHDTQQLQLTGSYRFAYTDYSENTSEDRSELSGDSAARIQLLPSRAYWSLTHSISEQRQSRDAIDTANNRERRQEFSTGPQLQVSPSKVDSIRLSASYGEIIFSDPADTVTTSPDAQIESASVNWQHAFSTLTDFVSGYSYREVTRELTSGDIETEFETAYVGFNRRLRELQYGAQIGTSKSTNAAGSSDTGLFYQVDITKTSASNTFGLTASRQQTDSSTGQQSFRQLFDNFDELSALFDDSLTQGNFDRTSTVEISSFEGRFLSSQFCRRCDYSLTYSFVDSDFNGSDIDDKEHNANLQFSHRLNSQLRATLGGSWQKTEFDNDTEQVETRSALTLYWTPNDKLSISLTGGYEDREDDNNGGYHNSFAGIGFNYTLLEARD